MVKTLPPSAGEWVESTVGGEDPTCLVAKNPKQNRSNITTDSTKMLKIKQRGKRGVLQSVRLHRVGPN